MAPVEIYTKFTCFFCARAKALLDQKGVKYNEIKIDVEPERRAEMIERSGGTTVPQIFINNQVVGGCDDLFMLHSQGKLDDLLAS